MPAISRFHGIVIAIYYNDHPPPHFHALCGSHEMIVGIEDGRVTGHLPGRAHRRVLRWYNTHRVELLVAWNLAREHKPLPPVAPLESWSWPQGSSRSST